MYDYLQRFRKHFPNRKFFQLIDKVYETKNLEESWKKVKDNKGCAGVDEQSISDFQKQSEMYLREIQRVLKSRTYKSMPTLRKLIPKDKNNMRPLGIPTVKDRIVQQATKQVIEQIFEMKFLDCSYGYRPNKNAHQAIKEIKTAIQQGYNWVIDADVEKFFDSVNHKMLMNFIAEEISDGNVLNLVETWLKAGVMNQGQQEETLMGTPQGGVISPLLANIYLHEMDEQITEIRNIRLIRYADDFVILCKKKEDAEETMKQVIDILTGLKLRLNKKKTRIVNVNREYVMFLGFKLKRVAGKVMITPRMKSIKEFKRKIKQVTRRKQPVKPKEMIWRLNTIIQGWGNYYFIGTVKKLFERLDRWIRTRVRTFIEKKKSSYANRRIPTYILQSEYKLTSLTTLINLHSL